MFGIITMIGGVVFIFFLKEIKGVSKAELALLYCSNAVKEKTQTTKLLTTG